MAKQRCLNLKLFLNSVSYGSSSPLRLLDDPYSVKSRSAPTKRIPVSRRSRPIFLVDPLCSYVFLRLSHASFASLASLTSPPYMLESILRHIVANACLDVSSLTAGSPSAGSFTAHQVFSLITILKPS
uniref:Uncharacterized protein n=1 Tax=Anopheles atroparvus TaxID=41427 RepID=A0AAG5DNK6_ANOAO